MKLMEQRLRNLSKTKAYRDSLSELSLRNQKAIISRKRIIIAPSMETAAESGGYFTSTESVMTETTTGCDKKQRDATNKTDVNGYKCWMKNRVKLRKDLNKCDMVSDWLQRKPTLTEIEQHFQKSQVFKNAKEASKRRKNTDAHGSNMTGGYCDPRYAPRIEQPVPAALAIIHNWLTKRRLRFYDLFVQADQDKDWKITRKELKDVIIKIGIPLNNAEIDLFVQTLDENNDDCLEYKEFAHGRDLYILDERLKKHTSQLDDNMTQQTEKSGAIVSGQPPNSARDDSSQTFLVLPETGSSDHIFSPTKDLNEEKRSKRQKKLEKHRPKFRSSTEPVRREPCTVGGLTGILVDDYEKQKEKEYERILELCHLHGMPFSKHLLARVLLHPEERSRKKCIASLKPASRYLISEEDLYRKLAPDNADVARTRLLRNKRKLTFYSYNAVYPPASSVTPKIERMNLSSGPAGVSRRTDCWMSFEEYSTLTRHLDSRLDKSWQPVEESDNWPSYVFDKVRLYLERPSTQVRSENSIFEIVHNKSI